MKTKIKMGRHVLAALFAIVTLSLLLTACINQNGNNSQQYNTGYGFLTVQIDPIMPDNVIYIDSLSQTVNVITQITNDMYMPANNVVIKATNYNNNAISLDAFNNIFNSPLTMHGYDQEHGAKDMQFFKTPVYVRTIRNQPYQASIRFTACADTQTLYSGVVCLAPSDTSNDYTRTCNPGPQTVSGGQGAPVAVTSIKTLQAASTVTFTIQVVNKGSGLVYRKGQQDSCGVFLNTNDVGYITMDYLKVGGKELTGCSNKQARMGYELQYQKNSGATFICTVDRSLLGLDTQQQSTLQESIEAQFSYSYTQQVGTQNILIKNAPGYSYTTQQYEDAISNPYPNLPQPVAT